MISYHLGCIFNIANCRIVCQMVIVWHFQQKQYHMRIWCFIWEKDSEKVSLYSQFDCSVHRNKMAYEEKKKMLFDCLLTAEKNIIGTSLEQKELHIDRLPQKTESKVVGRRFQGRESIFKRPAAPISKCLKPRRAPDYQVCFIYIELELYIVSYLIHKYLFISIHIHTGKSTQMEKVFIVRCRYIGSNKYIGCICISQGNWKTKRYDGRWWRYEWTTDF